MSDRQYAWVEDDEELSAACFTAVTGVGVEEVVRRFGADPTAERTATFAEAFNALTGTAPLLYDELDGDVLVAENNGWQGSRPEVLEGVSRGGRAASVYWSVNADMAFVYAVDGVVVAWFDPLLVEHEWTGSDPDSVRRQATDLPFGKTRDNLKAAIAGETHEYTDMYPGMAKTARSEGFSEIADWFETLAKAERSHANRFQKALDALAD